MTPLPSALNTLHLVPRPKRMAPKISVVLTLFHWAEDLSSSGRSELPVSLSTTPGGHERACGRIQAIIAVVHAQRWYDAELIGVAQDLLELPKPLTHSEGWWTRPAHTFSGHEPHRVAQMGIEPNIPIADALRHGRKSAPA